MYSTVSRRTPILALIHKRIRTHLIALQSSCRYCIEHVAVLSVSFQFLKKKQHQTSYIATIQVMHAASLQSWYEGQISEICKKYDMEVKMLHETIECQQKKLNSMRQELQASRIQGQECRRCFNQLLASTAGRNDMDVWIVPIANQPQQGIEDQ